MKSNSQHLRRGIIAPIRFGTSICAGAALANTGCIGVVPSGDTPVGPGVGSSSPDWLVPIALFAAIVAFAVLVAVFKLRQSRMMHETLRLSIEKGQPIPPDLLRFAEPQRSSIRDLRYGLICIALGLGLSGYALASHDANWSVGLIPFLIGCAFLITRRIESGSRN